MTRTKTKKKKMSTLMKISIAMCIVYLSGLGMMSMLRDKISDTTGSTISLQQKSLDAFRRPKIPVSEVYVLSLLEAKANIFEHRNLDMDMEIDMDMDDTTDDKDNDEKTPATPSTTIEWFPAYDGMDQSVLNEWSSITKLPLLNASDFMGMDAVARKQGYASPHAVGCYMSHWRVLEKAWKSWGRTRRNNNNNNNGEGEQQQQQRKQRRPDMLFIFEDDAYCVSKVIERTWKVVRQLPKDWDILYIGGKPISYYTMGKTLMEYITMARDNNNNNADTPDAASRPSDKDLLEGMCRGDYGTSLSGPFSPPSTSTTTSNINTPNTYINTDAASAAPYWQVKNILNTNAYVVNPKRIGRILRVLSKPLYEYKPIDVILADDMFREFLNPSSTASYNSNSSSSTSSTSAPLKAYMTPKLYCDQEAKRMIVNRDDPPPDWEGYHWLPWRFHKGFPDFQAYVWGITASENACVPKK